LFFILLLLLLLLLLLFIIVVVVVVVVREVVVACFPVLVAVCRFRNIRRIPVAGGDGAAAAPRTTGLVPRTWME